MLRCSRPLNHRRLLLSALATLLATLGGCDRGQDGGTQRFRGAYTAPCLLWRDALLDPRRPPVSCPWPAVGADPAELPCAIEYFVGEDPQPRVVRRLKYDADGRLVRYSDHRDGTVVEARAITYDSDTSNLVVNDFALGCNSPAPQHLFSQTYGFDESWRLSSWRSAGRNATIDYTYEAGLFGARASTRVTGLGKARWAHLDRHGHVVEHGLGREPTPERLEARGSLEHDDGRLRGFVQRDPQAELLSSGTYTYEGGRLASLSLTTAGRSTQRYVFRYTCTDSPECSPHPPRPHTHHGTRTALSFDPKLEHFVPRDCSDQFAHSGTTCGTLLGWGGGFSMACCKTSNDEIQIRSDSPFTRGRVDGMVIEGDGTLEIRSSYCAKAENEPLPPWACRFPRAELLSAQGKGTVSVLGRDGQIIHQAPVDLAAVARAAR